MKNLICLPFAKSALIVLAVASLSVTASFGDSSVDKSTIATLKTSAPETGVASYYGTKYHGRPTASGEVFNMNDLTAAHPTLKFGTKVKVTHLANNLSVTVRINDRGPFVKGRVIDLSQAAAEQLQ